MLAYSHLLFIFVIHNCVINTMLEKVFFSLPHWMIDEFYRLKVPGSMHVTKTNAWNTSRPVVFFGVEIRWCCQTPNDS